MLFFPRPKQYLCPHLVWSGCVEVVPFHIPRVDVIGIFLILGVQEVSAQRAVHMLPERLATNIRSLKPEDDRLAVAVILDDDRQGRLKGLTGSPGPWCTTTHASPIGRCKTCWTERDRACAGSTSLC